MEQQEVLRLLDAGDFDALIGAAETGEIDFKRDPYRVDQPREAFELAKDVAALANTPTGGLLVVGFKARKLEGSDREIVETVHVFARARFDRDAWIDSAQQRIHPTVVGLDATFKPSRNDADRGAVVVVVPAQVAESRYFLVATEFVSDDGAPGWLVGVSVRSSDRNRPLGIAEIHALMTRGMNTGAQLDGISALVQEIHTEVVGAGPQVEAPVDVLAQRLARAIDAVEGP
jgi:hypothetical protein